jgi:type IV secretion system protein TrbL
VLAAVNSKQVKKNCGDITMLINFLALMKRTSRWLLPLCLGIVSIETQAAIENTGILDNVLGRYLTAAGTWSAFITAQATWLFWTLAIISMVWTFGLLALQKADLGDFFAEFVRFTIFTGFFWWLLINGPNFAVDIMNSLRSIGAKASGVESALMPSGIVDIGFDIFFKVLDQSSLWAPVDSATGLFVSAIILIVLALIGVNMLLLLVSGWILAYAGIFFLGFGGARWTSDIAINYYKTVLNIAAQLFTMVLLVGIGKSFVDQYYSAMSAGISLKELVVMMVVAIVLLALVNKLPTMVGGLAMGGGTHALGSGFGASAAMGAVTVAGVTIAAGGTAVMASLPNAARGTQSLFDAFTKAAAADNRNSSSIDNGLGLNAGGYLRSGEPGTLATAMGDNNSPVVRAHAASYDSIRSASSGHDLHRSAVRDTSHSPNTDSETQQGHSQAGSLASSKSDSVIDSAESEIAAFVNSKPT